jgi:uncharacterized protein YoxC
MAVLPESMDKLNVDDAPGSLSTIENYIRYMGERIEFSLRNVTRNVSEAGVSSAEMYVLITAMQNSMSALQSTVNGLTGSVNTLSGQITALQDKVADIEGSVNTMSGSVSALEARVAALEAGTQS